VKKIIASALSKTARIAQRASNRIYTSSGPLTPHDLVVEKWKNARGDSTLRLNYPLSSESVVFDMGGYEGQWSADIFTRYGCYIHVFEPMVSFASTIKDRFKHNDKVKVYEFGLSDKDKSIELSQDLNASSAYVKNDSAIKATLKDAFEFINKSGITSIDLIKINIEGGEYDLLDRLIETGFVKNITDIQVQFHNFVPNAQDRMQVIQTELSKTHELTYQYPFVWENWHRKQ
jgi:FkbM family methyltransferase